tara:strand:- start:170 stop:1093 length:924 start_codon:yes stop_codon:yes gene_type:complete
MPFEKAAKTANRLKLLVYGESGTGKTITALHFPAPAVFDAERGTEFYGEKFDFDVHYTADSIEIIKDLEKLIKDPNGYKSLVIDSFTSVYEAILDRHLRYMRKKTGDKNYDLKPLDYKAIKNQVRMLVQMLLALDMNIIVTAQSKTLYEPGEFMKPVGTTPDGPKNLPYLFDTVLELTIDKKTGKRMARTEKDRSNNLPDEFEFTYQKLVEYWGVEGFEREAVSFTAQKKLDELAGRHHEVKIGTKQLMTAGIEASQLKELQSITKELGEETLSEKLQADYMVTSVLDLKSDEAAAFIEDLTQLATA